MVLTSTAVILVIIGLLYAYEMSVHLAKHYLPPQLLPVLNVMLAEIAGLGFIGLLLQIAEGYFAHSIEMMSELSFGEEEALVEAFEWFHNKFFEVATIFCIFGGGMLFYVVGSVRKLMGDIQKADADGDGDVTIEEFTAAFGEGSLDDKRLLQMVMSCSIGLSTADSYLFSERFIKTAVMPLKKPRKQFNPLTYIETVGAANLEELVELSPFVWLMMMPPLAYMEYTKISVEIPGDDLKGVAAGIYASSPVMLCFSFVVESMGLLWVAYNYCMVLAIKRILRPRVETIEAKGTFFSAGKLQIMPPKLYDENGLDDYLSMHKNGLLAITHVAANITGCKGSSSHPHHQLFGTAGDKGAEMLLLSIKFSTWFCVAAVTFCLTSIVFPCIAALTNGSAGPPVVTETIIFGFMGASFLIVLIFVVPPTFEIFNLITSIEGMKNEGALKKALGEVTLAHGHPTERVFESERV